MFESDNISMHAAANEFLREFGGLALDVVGSGVDMAKAPSQFDPQFCADEGDLFREWSPEYGPEIFPYWPVRLGTVFSGARRQCGDLSCRRLGFLGCVPEAIENLVLGVRPKDL
jgi:hypothetical protein